MNQTEFHTCSFFHCVKPYLSLALKQAQRTQIRQRPCMYMLVFVCESFIPQAWDTNLAGNFLGLANPITPFIILTIGIYPVTFSQYTAYCVQHSYFIITCMFYSPYVLLYSVGVSKYIQSNKHYILVTWYLRYTCAGPSCID